MLDQETTYIHADASIQDVAAHVAYYNLIAAPVVDDQGRLLGAVTVDDLLDHMLPENWRDHASSADLAEARASGPTPGPTTGR